MTRAALIIAALSLSGCLAAPIPQPATVCGPLRGVFAEITGTSAADVQNACAIFTAIHGK